VLDQPGRGAGRNLAQSLLSTLEQRDQDPGGHQTRLVTERFHSLRARSSSDSKPPQHSALGGTVASGLNRCPEPFLRGARARGLHGGPFRFPDSQGKHSPPLRTGKQPETRGLSPQQRRSSMQADAEGARARPAAQARRFPPPGPHSCRGETARPAHFFTGGLSRHDPLAHHRLTLVSMNGLAGHPHGLQGESPGDRELHLARHIRAASPRLLPPAVILPGRTGAQGRGLWPAPRGHPHSVDHMAPPH